jgi:hypothetical protein
VVRTFLKAFPNSMLACLGSDAALVGFKSTPSINLEKMGRQFRNERLKKELIALGAIGPADVMGWMIADAPILRMIAADAPGIQTMDRPILAGSAPLSQYIQGYSATAPALLMGFKLLTEESMAQQLRSHCEQELDKEFLRQAYDARKSREWLIRGLVARSFGNADRFLGCMEIAYGARPTDLFVMNCLAEAQTRLGSVQFNNGMIKEALEQHNLAMGNDPSQIDAVVGAAKALLAQRDILATQQLLDGALSRRPEVFQLLEMKARLAAEMGLNPKRQCEEAMKKGQATPESLLLYASALLRDHNVDDSVLAMREAAKFSSSPARTLAEILRICQENDHGDIAREFAPALIEAATRGIRIDPINPDYYAFRARAHDALGEFEKRDRDQLSAAALSW